MTRAESGVQTNAPDPLVTSSNEPVGKETAFPSMGVAPTVATQSSWTPAWSRVPTHAILWLSGENGKPLSYIAPRRGRGRLTRIGAPGLA